MKKIFKISIIIVLFSIICITKASSYADSKINYSERVLKVGFYDHKPYYFINKNGNKDGYYHDLLNILIENTGIKYEYVVCDFADAINKLENGEIDLLLGLHRTDERNNKFIYTDNYIDIETYRIYTNRNIEYGKLDQLEGLKFSLVKSGTNSNWIYNFLESKNITTTPIWTDTDKEAIRLLTNKDVDVTIASINNRDLKTYKSIYEFSAGPVYIVGNKNNQDIIKILDNKLKYYKDLDNRPINKIYRNYFNVITQENKNKILVLSIIASFLVIIMFFIIMKNIYPNVKKNRIQNIIRNRMKNNEYLLYYQPIVDPKKDSIVGFEALLRLNDPKEGILSPYKFINEIVESDMLSEISIWVLKQVLLEYNKIKECSNMISENFYISINLSIKEIENKKFLQDIINVLQEYEIKDKSICLEIVESVKISNLEELQKSIKILKEYGFKIAIDDFGVEYSNLDILEKLDFDIIKLDKYFVDNISESEVRQCIMQFISDLTILKNKSLVAEGVEDVLQKDIIQNSENDKFFIQGYFYSKPVSTKDISKINIKNK